MKRTLALAAILSLALGGIVHAQCGTLGGECLDDGPFDLADSGTQDSNSDWVMVANIPNGVDNASQFQTGFANANNTGAGGTQPPGTGTGIWYKSFAGNQNNNGVFAQSDLSQSVVVPTSGKYVLDFVAGRETFFTASELSVTLSSSGTGGSGTVDLLTASIPNGNIGGAASDNKGGTPFSITLADVTGGDTLTVRAIMVDGEDAGENPQSAFLDNFSLSRIPEPTSAILCLLGAIGLFAVRRR